MKTEEKDTRRRDLSGIYIFDTLPQDKRRKPTCVEDCTEETRFKWLVSLEPEAQRRTAEHLNECFGRIWEMLEPGERESLKEACGGEMPFCDPMNDPGYNADEINRFCKLFRTVADIYGICAKGSEAAPDYKPDEDDD